MGNNNFFPIIHKVHVDMKWVSSKLLYIHVSMSDVSQYSRHKPAGPDITSPRDKTSETMDTETPRRVRLMLYRNLCVMQTGQLPDFMTCAELPSSGMCMDRGFLSARAVIIGTISCQPAVYVVHFMYVFEGWLRGCFYRHLVRL
jgi:hypothetical protein